MIITYILIKFTNIFNFKTTTVFNSIDEIKKENYILNMKFSYLLSTAIIIFIITLFYLIRKKVAYKNIDYKKEGG